MLTRRAFAARIGITAAGLPALHEFAFAQRALVQGDLPKDMVWLNANENPEGPPRSSIQAMTEALPISNRYHYQEFGEFYEALARSEDLNPDQVLIGSGSSEVLHAAVDAFTSPTRPMVAMDPTYESPPELTRKLSRKVILVPLTSAYTADVKGLAAEATKSNAGIVYLCNPNNPTSSVTPKADIAWLVANVPSDTVVLIDEAYMHFADTPEMESALSYVRQGKNVVVTRTFSKIYGMAGLRAGFAAARPDYIQRMHPFRNNVISYVTVRAVLAALAESKTLLPARKARIVNTRAEVCSWLHKKNLRFINPQANFMMIDIGRDPRQFGMEMARRGIAVGRPFPPLNTMLRVSIGSDRDMARFRDVFWSVYNG